jgi:hypothetical protein
MSKIHRHDAESDLADVERWLDSLDPATTDVRATPDLADIGRISLAAERLDEALVSAVTAARVEHHRSWTEIGVALGVTRQAAHARFAKLVEGRAAAPAPSRKAAIGQRRANRPPRARKAG